jgi:hypothetical protein
VNAAELLILLLEAPGGISRTSLGQIAPATDILLNEHLITRGQQRQSFGCDRCDFGHAAEIEFDAVRREYGFHCIESGWITVSDLELETIVADLPQVIDWFRNGCGVETRPQSRSLVPCRIWLIGEIGFADGAATIVLIVGLDGEAERERAYTELRKARPGAVGIALTTTAGVPADLLLRYGYHVLPLGDVLDAEAGLSVDRDSIREAIRRLSDNRSSARRRGRPSGGAEIEQLYRERRDADVLLKNASDEARAIATAWRASRVQKPPAHSTIRNCVAKLMRIAEK